MAIWPDPLADLAKGLEAPQSVPGSKLEQHWVSLPKVAVQIAEGREIGEVAGQLYQALSDGLLVAEAEIHRVYNEPIRGGEAFKFHLEWPRVGQLSRDWWMYGRACIDPPGTRTFEPKDPSVASVFSQLLEALAKEGTECWELTLTKPYGNRAGGHPNDLDLATKIRCLRSDVERIFEKAVRAKMMRGKSVEKKTDVPAQGASGSGTQSSQKRQRGGRKPGPYYSKLKKFMELLYERDSEKFEKGTPAKIRDMVLLRFEKDRVVSYPKTRSGLDKAIEKAKQEVIEKAKQEVTDSTDRL